MTIENFPQPKACGKITFDSKAQATHAALGLGNRTGHKAVVYYCSECEGWHITSPKKKIAGGKLWRRMRS